MKKILTAARIESGEWEAVARAEIDTARTRANARWAHLAQQYLDRLGRTARTATPLGRGASPIIVIDGRYLMTMNTIWQQGGLRTAEKLFQTVNSLIRMQLETGGNAKEETKMNYTAAALAGAIALGAACAIPVTNEAVASEEEQQFPNWTEKWKKEGGEAEVVDEAHIQMNGSGTVLRIIGIAQLDDPEQARIAKEGIATLINGKKLDCWWLPEPAAAGNPMAAAPDGTPWVSCGVRKVNYTPCKDVSCLLQDEVVTHGYGIPEAGAWEQRSRNASKWMVRWAVRETEARRQKIGIWAE